jgi:hypothetical protein
MLGRGLIQEVKFKNVDSKDRKGLKLTELGLQYLNELVDRPGGADGVGISK